MNQNQNRIEEGGEETGRTKGKRYPPYERPAFRVLCRAAELCAMSTISACSPTRFKRNHSALFPEIVFQRT